MSRLLIKLTLFFSILISFFSPNTFGNTLYKNQFPEKLIRPSSITSVVVRHLPKFSIKPSHMSFVVTIQRFKSPYPPNLPYFIPFQPYITPLVENPVKPIEPSQELSSPPADKTLSSLTSLPRSTPHQYCRQYMKQAARKTGVLPSILWAIANAESSYEGGPWPWTLNVKGKSYYFPSHKEAKEFLKSLPPKIKYRVDIGCMQLNWGYHGKDFPYPAKMLNPRVNVDYAAFFLKDLYKKTGNWAKAIAAYHSQKWHLGRPYAHNVAQQLKHYQE